LAWYDCIKTGTKLTERGRPMRSGAAKRLREPEDPGRATFLELFFDLVFVLALFRLSQGLLDHMSWAGAFQTVVLLLAVWWIWSQTSAVADRFDPRQPAIQLLVIGCMFGAFVLADAVPGAFGARGLVFAGAYVAVQVGRSLFLVAATWGDERQRPEVQVLFCFWALPASLWVG
jgi:low temperature requirement protein LtrA